MENKKKSGVSTTKAELELTILSVRQFSTHKAGWNRMWLKERLLQTEEQEDREINASTSTNISSIHTTKQDPTENPNDGTGDVSKNTEIDPKKKENGEVNDNNNASSQKN